LLRQPGGGITNAERLRRVQQIAEGASLSPARAYLDLIRLFDSKQVTRLSPDFKGHASQHFTETCGDEHLDLAGLLQVNMKTYLPDDLLINTDRTSMAASLETRAPLLDHWLVEMAATIPLNLKLKGSTTKYLLKQIAADLLPPEIVNRPQRNPSVPLGAWLRKDPRQVRETLLSPEARGRGLFHTEAVEVMIDDHLSGRREHGQRLWSLLTLEWWHRLFIDPPTLRVP
jgi:asparagine synthase (glutamine-hydrolysing)